MFLLSCKSLNFIVHYILYLTIVTRRDGLETH